MSFEELDREITLRKEELIKDPDKEAYQSICKLMEDYRLYDIMDFIDTLDIWEFLKHSLYINCEEKDMELYSLLVDYYKDFFDDLRACDVERLLTTVLSAVNEGKIDELISSYDVKTFKGELLRYKYYGSVLACKLNEHEINLVPFLEEAKVNKVAFITEYLFYLTYRKVEDFCSGKTFEVTIGPSNKHVALEELKRAVLTRELSDFFDVQNIEKKLKSIGEFRDEYERKSRNNQKELTSLEISRNRLAENKDKKQIVFYRDIIKGLKSPRMKYLFLCYIKDHNEIYHEELKRELDKLSKDSKISVQALFNKYGIPEDSYDYDTLPSYTLEEFESILKVLSSLTISNEEKLSIIKSTNISIVNTIKDYLYRDVITVEFLSNNPDLFSRNSNKIDYLNDNITLLKSFNIPVSIFSNSMEILTHDSMAIKNNIVILNTYNLLSQLANTSNLRFLFEQGIEEKIDKFLELGYGEYLENDLDLLNKKELERLEILRAIGIPIDSREKLNQVLDNEFFVPIDSIDTYLPDDYKYVEEPKEVVDLCELLKYRSSDRLYDFNGVKISIEKVIRMVENGNSLYQAIIHNTHLNKDELSSIIRIIRANKPKELKK